MTPEAKARATIDALLQQAGWHVCDMGQANIHAARGVAIREFPLNPGYGFADYLLYIDGKAAGVIEAKKEGTTLTGVEMQSARYAQGMPPTLPAWVRPLPFSYESTGIETHFTQGLDPLPRARAVFAFHRPETLAAFLSVRAEPVEAHPSTSSGRTAEEPRATYGASAAAPTFLGRLQSLPPLKEAGLWPAQIIAIRNLEASLKANKPRALIQMATGSGKTFTSISFIYRLIKFGGARRVLFLVDRGNLGEQAKKEFDQYTSPYNNYKFGEEYIVQYLQSNQLDTTARVTICTIQRLFSMLKGRDLAAEDDEQSFHPLPLGEGRGEGGLFSKPEPISYNKDFPIETFDVIVTDEAHRSIYNLWRQVLEYFDAYLIGLTATPSKQTFGFFNQNLVMEYGHQQAVADGVNVNYDVYRIRTQVSEQGSQIEAGYSVGYRDRLTRKTRWQELDEDMAYDADALDRAVQTPDQIRTIVRTFRDKLHTEIFPGRTEVPKTLVFAKDDNHADKIVEILREEFGKGNDFAQKITYRSYLVGGDKPKNLINAFRNSYNPRIAVTVDMIATGTDIKPVEIVMFMRSVKSRNFFEQMKGRGVRIIPPTDLQAVTPDAVRKTHFVIVDCVGVCEQDKTDSAPMDAKKSVPFDKLLQAVALGNVEPEVLSSVAARLARLDRELTEPDRQRIAAASGGYSLKDLAKNIVNALDPDFEFTPSPAAAGEGWGEGIPQTALSQAVKPLHDPALRNLLIDLKKKAEQVIDTVTQDQLLEADFSEAARARAKGTVESFEKFIADHRDEITALQILYQQPQRLKGLQAETLTFEALKALADTLQAPPHLWTEGQLWQAYAALDKTKVKGDNRKRILTDLVSLVRFAMHQSNELVPFPERVNANFKAWLGSQENLLPDSLPLTLGEGRGEGSSSFEGSPPRASRFTPEQLHWLDMIREHIAGNLTIVPDDFEYSPFAQEGGMGRVYQLFGAELPKVLEAMNRELAA